MPVVIDAKYIADYKIRLTFDNGEQKIADLGGKLGRGVFKPLKDKQYFKKFLCRWLDDLVAERCGHRSGTLYEESEAL